jgi:hypothetical protein
VAGNAGGVSRQSLAASTVSATDAAGGAHADAIALTNEVLAFLDRRVNYNPECRKRVLAHLGAAVFTGTTAQNKRPRTFAAWAAVQGAYPAMQ